MGVFVRAQSSIETLVMVAFGLLLLVVITEIIFSNASVYYGRQQEIIGTQSLSILASEIDDVYFSGPGTIRTVRIEIPDQMDLQNSYILDKSLVMNINGSEHVGTTRVPVRGVWPNATGGYTFKLVAYGDFVAISTDLLEFNPSNIAVSLNQASVTTLDINILNLSSSASEYTFTVNFSHSNASVTSTDAGVISFLASDYNQITLNFSCSQNAVGNYDGNLFFDGEVDISVPIKLYCVAGQSRLSVYPSSKDFNQTELTNANQTLQVCNSSNSNYSSSSSFVSGEISAYAFTSFSGDINANSCRTLTLAVNAPATSGDKNIYLGTITVSSAGFTSTADLNLLVTEAVGEVPAGGGGQSYYFASIANSDLNHWFDYTGKVKQRNSDNAWVATGELDWNVNSSFAESSAGTPLQSNNPLFSDSLVALWHLDLNLEDSSGNGHHCSWTSSSGDENTTGLWDTNAIHLNGSSDYISCGTDINPSGASAWTISAWIKSDTVGTNDGVIGWYGGSGGLFLQSALSGEGLLPLAGTGYGSVACETTDDWVHAVLVYDGTQSADADELKFYLNGAKAVLSFVGAIPDVIPSVAGQTLKIGDVGALNRKWDGKIEEVAMWNSALTREEVLALYESQKPFSYDNNLVAYFKFDGDLTDSVGSFNGTAQGSATATAIGLWDTNALTLEDATTDYVTFSNSNRLSFGDKNFAISAWVRTGATANGLDTIIEKINSSNGYFIQYNPSSGAWAVGWDSGTYYAPTYSINDGKWHHIVFQRTGHTNSEFYIDGVLIGTKTDNPDTSTNNPSALWVGMLSGSNPSRYWDGEIDDLKIYDKALTYAEVLSDYTGFLSAKFVDANIIDAGASVDWNAVKINSDVNYSFGKEICGISNNGCSVDKWNDGLVGLWHFNETGTSFVDSSGNGNIATCSSCPTQTSGLWNTSSRYFDKINDYVTAEDNISLEPANVTLSVWFYPDGLQPTDTHYVRLVKKEYDPSVTSPYISYGFVFNSTGDRLEAVVSEGTPDGIPDFKVKLNAWNHAVMTYDGATLKIYLDGFLVESQSKGAIQYSTGKFIFGQSYGTNLGRFKGNIDEVAIWDRALSDSEILDLYRKGVSKLDLNVYTCSNASCSTKGTPQLISDTNNNSWMSIPVGVSNSQYLGYEVIFGKANGFSDANAGTFSVGSFLKDVNISYSS